MEPYKMTAYVCSSCNVYVDVARHVRCLACGVRFEVQPYKPVEPSKPVEVAPVMTDDDVDHEAAAWIAALTPAPVTDASGLPYMFSDDGQALAEPPRHGTFYVASPRMVRSFQANYGHRPFPGRVYAHGDSAVPAAVTDAIEQHRRTS